MGGDAAREHRVAESVSWQMKVLVFTLSVQCVIVWWLIAGYITVRGLHQL